jgi:acyl-CoA dehydrogenase
MNFETSAKCRDYRDRLVDFMVDKVFPAEPVYHAYREAKGRDDHTVPPVVEDLKRTARAAGLWNLFLPSESGLTNLEYASLAELSGWSMDIAPEALNCQAPDTGNMETLHLFATEEQRSRWLNPLLAGQIRSAFAMTEPAVASSDARNIQTTMLRDGGGLRHQRPQVVDHGGCRPALHAPHRDGPHESRCRFAPAAVDDPGAG